MREYNLATLPHAGAYNPALIHWQGRMLMMYRTGGWHEGELFLGEVDGEFHPKGDFRRVCIPLGEASYEDPRFFIYNGQLHFSFVAFKEGRHSPGIGTVTDDLDVRDCRFIHQSGGRPSEKNWIFFQHGEQLYFTYSMADGVHHVSRLVDGIAEPCHHAQYRDVWTWGQARAGTQLIAHEGLWYGFFHGTAFHHEGIAKRYFMGAYAVSPGPPFPIVKMSRTPLYTPPESSFCGTSDRSKGHDMAVIFPSGLLLRDGVWQVAAGYNDRAIKIFEIPHAELESNLASTQLGEESEGAPGTQPAGDHGKTSLVHFPVDDRYWMEALDAARKYIGAGQVVFAHEFFLPCFSKALPYTAMDEESLQGADWVLFHKGCVKDVSPGVMHRVKNGFDPVFANEVFVLFASKKLKTVKTGFDPLHVESLWAKVDQLAKDFAALHARPASPGAHVVASRSPSPSMMHSVPRINVGILTHNALEYTQRCLASLAKFATEPCRIFVVDNLSTDGTREWLEQQAGPDFIYDPSPVNLGVPGGRNRLIGMMQSHLPEHGFAVFLDNDVEMTGPWQEPFLEIFGSNPWIGVVGKDGFEITVGTESRELLSSHRLVPSPVDIVSGFAFWTRAETLRQVGDFDETLGLFWHEDDDFCIRAIAAGWEVFEAPHAPLVHHAHKSGAAMPGIAAGGSPGNQHYLAQKWRDMGVVDRSGRIIHQRCVWLPRESHFPANDPYWLGIVEVARKTTRPGDLICAQECFLEFFPQSRPYFLSVDTNSTTAGWIVFHKDNAEKLGADVMRRIREEFRPVFANEVFVLFKKGKPDPSGAVIHGGEDRPFPFDPAHVDALWKKVEKIRVDSLQEARGEKSIVGCITEIRSSPSGWPPAANPTDAAGIVISACGRLFRPLYANIRNLRALGCALPVDVWHLPGEFTEKQRAFLGGMATMVDAGQTPFQGLSGRHEVHGFKAWMLSHSRFRKTLMLDVNSFALRNPGFIFDCDRSCIMWSDGPWEHYYESVSRLRRALRLPVHPREFESGQLFVDRQTAGVREALRLAATLNTLGPRLYEYTYGDKETYSIAFDLLSEPFTTAPVPEVHQSGFARGTSGGGLLQPWLDGSPLFYHPLGDKAEWWRYKKEWAALEKEAAEAEASCR